MMTVPKVWTNDCDYVVAESAEEAKRLARAFYGGNDDPSDASAFEPCRDDRPFTFHEDGSRASQGVTKTFGEWAAERGRGYFCTSEF
ncbi:hypothetical protein [Sorangium sp. So ce388]|uniref:hypothetical protein n=1 Tax=Sorangium sp. So ce388 TaxID=3133309 RepID=UPI003F5C86CF